MCYMYTYRVLTYPMFQNPIVRAGDPTDAERLTVMARLRESHLLAPSGRGGVEFTQPILRSLSCI